jgi:hypothetical protein
MSLQPVEHPFSPYLGRPKGSQMAQRQYARGAPAQLRTRVPPRALDTFVVATGSDFCPIAYKLREIR